MILTGKAKIDFLKWFKKRNKIKLHEYEKVELVFKIQDFSYKNALIIEWLDSEDKINFQDLYMTEFKNSFLMYPISSIQKETILKANEIYNNLNTK